MAHAVFSDVHGNREAFEAVVAFCRQQGIDRYYFAGDIVGYGADPEACIALLRDVGACCILGNHDAAALGKLDTGFFNLPAQKAIAWTAGRLCLEERRILDSWPLAALESFMMVHGTPDRPETFGYVLSSYEALKAFSAFTRQLVFVGHTHRPGVFVEEKKGIHFDKSVSFTLSPGRRYIVNVGSVGQPRDGDPRACVCFFDEGKGTVTLHRVAYDVAGAAGRILAAGLPPVLAERLFEGR